MRQRPQGPPPHDHPEPEHTRSVTRRNLFAVAGLGAASLALPAAQSHARPIPAAATSPSLGPFPIGTWYHPPIAEVTTARLTDLADAGFTFVTASNAISGFSINSQLLTRADQAGLQALVTDQRLNTFPTMSVVDRAAIVDQYAAFPAFAGFHVRDEPQPADFPAVGDIVAAIRTVTSTALPFVNIFSSNQRTNAQYEAFLSDFIDTVDPSLLSYDRYPWVEYPQPSPYFGEYFNNWEMIRAAAIQHDLEPWMYIQGGGDFANPGTQTGWRVPTATELQWQVTVGLGYGVRGIQYFYYWPSKPEGSGLVDHLGNRLQTFDNAQDVNLNYALPLGSEMASLTSDWVAHVNYATLPIGTSDLPSNAWLSSTTGSEALVSLFTKTGSNHRWVFVGNPSTTATANVALTFDAAVGAVEEFDLSTGTYDPVSPTTTLPTLSVTVTTPPAGGRLLRLS